MWDYDGKVQIIFNVWLWLNKYCCLAVPAYHTRNCVIKCLQMKTKQFLHSRSSIKFDVSFYLLFFINQSIFLSKVL